MRTPSQLATSALHRLQLAASVAATPTNSKFGPPKPVVTGAAERNPGNPRSLRNRTRLLNPPRTAEGTEEASGPELGD